MVTLTAEYLDDLGRIRLTAGDLLTNVRYSLQRNTAFEPTWVDVRGGGNISTLGVTVVDDYEYTPNMVNNYRLHEPVFYDSFQRDFPSGAALEVIGEADSDSSTPDHASLDIIGDIELRVDFMSSQWPPLDDSTLIAKYNDDTSNRGYRLDVLSDGRLRFIWSTTGGNSFTLTSSTSISSVTGERLAVRVTFDANNGAAGRTAMFYTSDTIDGIWAQLGTSVTTAGVTTIFSNTALLEVGGRVDATRSPFTGLIFAAQVRSSIGGAIVANPRFVDQPPGTLSFADSTGKTWTVGANADIIEYAPVIGTDWGTADTGQAWNVGTTAAGYGAYVQRGVGVIQSNLPAGAIGEMLSDQIPGAEDAEVTWSALYPDNPALLTESVEWGVALRSLDFNNHYESNLRFRASTDGYDVELRIGRRVADVFTVLASTNVGTWSQNQIWNVRFRVQGVTLSAKAWTGDSEPGAWHVTATDSSIVAGTGVYVRAFKNGGVSYKQYFGPIEVNSIPADVAATASVTPVQEEVWLKSITYPLLNRELQCVDWDALTRESRAGFFNVKGRHEIVAITDVGSSATFGMTFMTTSRAENRAVVALLTYGGVFLLQPPGDTDEDCQVGTFSGTPGGYVVPTTYVQNHSVHGSPIWQWNIQFRRVAQSDAENITPTTITWEQLWAIIGPDGTWEDVWAQWSTWQELWQTQGSIDDINGGVLG